MTRGIGLSTVTIAELEFGVSNSNRPEQNRMALMEFLTVFESIPFLDPDAAAYGPLRVENA
jgi:tRNA(fMet)-specific endonuclease VapC